MQDDINTTPETTRTGSKGKKSNGKWAKEAIGEDLGVETGSGEDMVSGVKGAYDRVINRGSEMLSNVDLSRATGMVREYPVQAAIGGLVLGFLLGAAVMRRQSSIEE